MSLVVAITFSIAICLVLLAWFLRPGRCHSTVRLDGKVTIVTGANTGLGKETAKDFASRGAIVILACRDVTKGKQVVDEIRLQTGNENCYARKLDLGSLKSVREFATRFLKEFDFLHVLVNNAGIMMCPYTITEDGFEQQMGVNHFGHFALTNLLLPILTETGSARIVNLSSSAHRYFAYFNLDDLLWKKTKYSNLYAYGQSKLANIYFTKELNRKLDGTDISVFSVHPGAVKTDLARHYPKIEALLKIIYPYVLWPFLMSPKDGAQTQIHCSVEEGLEKLSGEYFMNCRQKSSSKMSYDVGMAKKLWEKSEELTNVKFPF